MNITVRKYEYQDIPEMISIWNEIVEAGNAFPQEELLTIATGTAFFSGQTYTGVAVNNDTDSVLGLYILHPNNIGRCGHIANASYAVASKARGHGIGKILVSDCIIRGRNCGFGILQFNAVVKTNTNARHLYEKLGFIQLGVIKNGFRLKNGSYEDICPYYITL